MQGDTSQLIVVLLQTTQDNKWNSDPNIQQLDSTVYIYIFNHFSTKDENFASIKVDAWMLIYINLYIISFWCLYSCNI